MAENPELLFFDTFSHGNAQELNLDLVQFTNPVYLTEIRVIPLGARVQADFPGGVRLGATNPSEFSVEFFVNDLSLPGATTFQNLGVLEYNQNGPIHYKCENKQIPTDGLILRGWYTTVTLAVYGFITKTRPPPSNLVPQPNPPPAAETPPLQVISEHKTAQWVQQHAQVYHKESDPYDVKDLNYDVRTPEWPQENKTEKDDSAKGSPSIQDEQKSSRKRSPEISRVKTSQRISSPENRSIEDLEVVKNEPETVEEKVGSEKACRLSPSKSIKLLGESKRKSDSDYQDEDEPATKLIKIKSTESVIEERERSLEKVDSPEEVREEVESEPELELEIEPVTKATLLPLPAEDVEMISDEEISEEEEEAEEEVVESPSMNGLQATDEVSDAPAETTNLSVHEDSLDLDQFEPILSGSSDIESEDDMDTQDMEFDPSDLVDEPHKMFDPFLFEVQPLMSLKPLHMTHHEWEVLQAKVLESTSTSNDKVEKFKMLLANVETKQFEDAMDDWVTTMENLIPLLEVGLIGCEPKEEIVSQLVKIVDIGLNFEKAYNQPKPVFKMRHLKAGVGLAEVLCRCSEDIVIELIKTIDLQHRLLDLFEKEYMAFSMRVIILRALDVTLNYGYGVKCLVTVDGQPNGYRRLVDLMRSTSTARVRYSLANLLRKVHLYETLENLFDAVGSADMTGDSVEAIVMYLEEVIKYLREAPTLISQPARFLPICSRFEFPRENTNANSYFVVYSYFTHFNFLDLLVNVISMSQLMADSHVVACVLEILAEFLDTEYGLLYLVTQYAATNRLLKLLAGVDDQLTLHLTHRLYVFNLIDSFQHKWQVEQMADIDNAQLLDLLSSLYHLSFTTLGRQSITHVLSRGDIIKPLLKALQYSHNTGRERRKSPGRAYIVDLVWLVVKGTDYVPFLERHYRDLIEITSWQSDLNNSAWLNPIRNGDQSFFYNDVTELCDYLKKHSEKVTSYPGELITALRILRYLGVSPGNQKTAEEAGEVSELKYKYVQIQVFGQDGLTFMTSMLHKICNHYEKPHLHAYTLAGQEGALMMAVLTPVVQLMRAILEYVIRCRDVDFKDLSAVPPLIKTFCLLHSIPPNSPIHAESVEISKEIVETLLVYTQTVAIEPMSDTRSLNKSLWTSMISEVVKFSTSVPEMFVPCLTLLSELLPLPLPVQTRAPLTDVEVSLVKNSRKLWSAHLLPLDTALQEMIGSFAYSSYQPLSQLLKRVCIQLADLGPPTALTVARSLLNSLWSELSTCELQLTSNCARLFGIFACLLIHAPFKMTVVQVTTSDTFTEFWPVALKHLNQPSEGNAYHVQAQEFIISSVQSLCDVEISLWPSPSQSVSLKAYLSNSLPPKNLFRSVCDALITHVGNAENTFSTISAALRACTTLTEYDYGMYRLKTCLSERSAALWNVARKVATEWSKENTDCVACLTNLLEFVKSGSSCDMAHEMNANLKTIFMSACELVEYLKWSADSGADDDVEEEKHPLLVINAFLLECAPEEELFQTLRSSVSALIDTLSTAQERDETADPAIETILGWADSLLTQFQNRAVFSVGDIDDERLSVAYWLTMTSLDDLEPEMEQVMCDVDEIVTTCIPNLNVESELEKLGHREMAHAETSATKKLDSAEQTEAFETKPTQTVLVKPAKPRTFIRPIAGGPHRNDAFRSRIPNSSRAPSLHVDDFIALEKHNQQQAAAGYNRLTVKHQAPDLMTTARNRGLGIFQDRPSHFHSPFRPNRGVLSTWHPLLAAEQASRTVVKAQPPAVIRHPVSAPLMIRGSDLMRFSLSLSRWPSPSLRPPVTQIRHHPPPHSSLHRHLRPPPSSFSPM